MLAIEVLSPGTARADRQVTRLPYQDEGVAEYWIVDANARLDFRFPDLGVPGLECQRAPRV